MKDTKIKLSLVGLDCANCANKIESKINTLEEVKEAHVNFSMGTLMVELVQPKEIDEIKNQMEEIVHSFEPDVKVENYNRNMEMATNLSREYASNRNPEVLRQVQEAIQVAVRSSEEIRELKIELNIDDQQQ